MTDAFGELEFPRTAVDSVQMRGWTVQTTGQAMSSLSSILTAHSISTCDEDGRLAIELARWLSCAAKEGDTVISQLTEWLNSQRPQGQDASDWEQLEIMLAHERPLQDLTSALRERYADPTRVLCMLLAECTSGTEHISDIEPWYQRAIEALLALGECQGLAYLLVNSDLLIWEDSRSHRLLVQAQCDQLIKAALTIWGKLTWSGRASVMTVFCNFDLEDSPLVEMLVSVDWSDMEYKTLGQYVEALSCARGAQALTVVQQVVSRALDDYARSRSPEAAELVANAFDLNEWISTDQRRRARELKIPMAG